MCIMLAASNRHEWQNEGEERKEKQKMLWETKEKNQDATTGLKEEGEFAIKRSISKL